MFATAGLSKLTSIYRYPKSLELVASGKINVKPLVTHRFQLDQVTEAFETARLGKGGAIKVTIEMPQ
jgi:L-iditol 2-dehydrogenase